MPKVSRVCEVCGKEFEVYPSQVALYNGRGGRFCSHACFGKSQRRTQVCEHCGRPSCSKRFCSRKCYNAYQRRNSKPTDVLAGGYDRACNAEFRQRIRERDGYKCTLCGRRVGKDQTESYRQRLPYAVVHHVDHCKSNSTAANCVLLCNSCHCRVHKNPEIRDRLRAIVANTA